ncbi:hypothetical protein BS329_17870 [Amycolatopsis coloradensis]|uniref:Uncharacterized protein n=1 Tax=Amycolatopsis coloradensis TaxID=76021 RepID=A0A1R0KT81_9PSEU|nr:hypothetical protein BS329_17870 [Amycolatopsis coloradensis]
MSIQPSHIRAAVMLPVVCPSLRRHIREHRAASDRTSAEVPGFVFTAAPRPVPRFILPPPILPSPRMRPAFGGDTAASGTFSALVRGGTGKS